MSELIRGSVIQITDPSDKWFPCIFIVDEVKIWGVTAYITIPLNGESPVGDVYYRIENGKFEPIGLALVVNEK